MITIAVQGQQASQMVEIQGAPQPAEGSGDEFRSAFAAKLADGSDGSDGSKSSAGASQPVLAAGRSALVGEAKGDAGSMGKGVSGAVFQSGAVIAKNVAKTIGATTLGNQAAMRSGNLGSSDAAPTALPVAEVPVTATGMSGEEASLVSGSSESVEGAGAATDASAILNNLYEVSGAGAAAASVSRAGDAEVTAKGLGLTVSEAGGASKTAQADRKPDATAAKESTSSNAEGIASPSTTQMSGAAVPAAASATAIAALTLPVQLDLATGRQTSEDEGLRMGGRDASNGRSALAANHAAQGTVSSASSGVADGATLVSGGFATGASMSDLAAQAETAPISVGSESGMIGNAAVAAAHESAASNVPGAGLQQGQAGTASVAKSLTATAENGVPESLVLPQMQAAQGRSDSLPPVDGAARPVAQANQKTVATAQSVRAATAQAAASAASSGVTTRPNGITSLDAAQAKGEPSEPGNVPQSGASFAQAIASQAAVGVQAVQPVETPREVVAVSGSAVKDVKTKSAESVSAAASSTKLDSDQSDAVTPSSVFASDAAVTVKDASSGTPVVPTAAAALPVAHSAAEAVPSLASHVGGALPPAATSDAPVTGSLGGVSAALAAHASAGASAAVAGRDPSLSHETLVATPTTLEVGVQNGTQGWLKIRAEVGGQGEVNASLAAGSSGAQEMLHSQLPALNAYLHSEQMPVTATVAERSFAFAGGQAGTGGHPGGYPGGSGDASGSGGSFFQGGAPQGDAGQRSSPQQSAISSDSVRGYGTLAGASELAATGALLQPGSGAVSEESGQWLNVRV